MNGLELWQEGTARPGPAAETSGGQSGPGSVLRAVGATEGCGRHQGGVRASLEKVAAGGRQAQCMPGWQSWQQVRVQMVRRSVRAGGRGRGHLTSLDAEEPLPSVHTLGWPPGHGLPSARSPPSAQGRGHCFPISEEGTRARGLRAP